MRSLPFSTLALAPFVSLAPFVTGACVSSNERAPQPRSASVAASARPVEATSIEVAGAPVAAAAQQPTPGSPYALSEDELSIWNDPRFKKRFIESYLAETEVEPRITILDREDMEEILELISANEIEEAIRQLERGSRDAASSPVFDFTLANIYFENDELDKAKDHYEAAVEKFPNFMRAWKNLGMIHVRQGNFGAAIPALTKVVELGENNGLSFGLLGFAYSNVENHIAAETAYRMAALLDPATMDWKMGLARSLFKQARYADAAALCSTLIATDPDRPDFWLLQANAYIGLNKPLEAAENFELVDRMGAGTPESLNTLGDIYVNSELYELATDTYLRAMEASADADVDRVLRAARVLTAQGALEQTHLLIDGLEQFHGEKISDEERKSILKLRSRVAVAEGAGDEEARLLEEIVELDPLDGDALLLLGQHSGRSGDFEKARFYFERAANLEEFEADAKLGLGQMLVRQGEYAEALPLLRRAQELRPRENVREYIEQVERLMGRG